MFGDGDLDIFFADFGSLVIAGDIAFIANFNSPGDGIDLQSLATVSGVDYSIEYKTAAAALAIRQQITVNGSPFQVTAVDPLDDGLITRAKLKSLSSPVGPGVTPGVTLPWGLKQFVETPDGLRVTFTFANNVKANPSVLQLIEDGLILNSPADYTLSSNGTQVTFVTAPESGSIIDAYC